MTRRASNAVLLIALAVTAVSGPLPGCSGDPIAPRSPCAQAPPSLEVPFGKMVAVVDGRPWESTLVAEASPSLGGEGVLMVGGLGDSINVTVQLPAQPAVGTYPLGEGWGGYASVMFLTSQGWVLYGTDRHHTGVAVITRVDSTKIAGVFCFVASDGRDPARVSLVTNGGFDVPMKSSSPAAPVPRTAEAAGQTRSGDPAR